MMQSAISFALALCYVGDAVGKLEIDVEGGSVNINSQPNIQVQRSGLRASAVGRGRSNVSPANCHWNIAEEARITVDYCIPGTTGQHAEQCAYELDERLCQCYGRYRWYAEVSIRPGAQRSPCECNVCHGGRTNGFMYYIAGSTTRAVVNLPDFGSCDFRRECRRMKSRGACYCSKTPRPAYADWLVCSTDFYASHGVCQ